MAIRRQRQRHRHRKTIPGKDLYHLPAPAQQDSMRKADAGAFVLSPAVQALEDDKDPFQELFFDADAVVADGELPFTAVLGGGDRNLGWAFGVTEFNGVDDKILEEQL